jgi:hypothetical protein
VGLFINTLKNEKLHHQVYLGHVLKALLSLKANDLLTILQADKDNAAVVLGTSDYNKITTLLQDKAYTKFKDPMESIESKTVFFLNKSLFTGELCQQV